jgi:hypothetical protein
LCQKCAKTHLRPSDWKKISGAYIPGSPRGGEGRQRKGRIGEGKGREREGEGEEGRGGGREGYSPSKNVCLSSPLDTSSPAIDVTGTTATRNKTLCSIEKRAPLQASVVTR